VRALDRTGQGLTALIIAIFALPVIALFVGMASDRSFLIGSLSWAPVLIITSVMRNPLRNLGLMHRLLAWFCIGVTGAAFFFLGRGDEFSLAIATVCGLALAVIESLTAYFDKRKMADR